MSSTVNDFLSRIGDPLGFDDKNAEVYRKRTEACITNAVKVCAEQKLSVNPDIDTVCSNYAGATMSGEFIEEPKLSEICDLPPPPLTPHLDEADEGVRRPTLWNWDAIRESWNAQPTYAKVIQATPVAITASYLAAGLIVVAGAETVAAFGTAATIKGVTALATGAAAFIFAKSDSEAEKPQL